MLSEKCEDMLEDSSENIQCHIDNAVEEILKINKQSMQSHEDLVPSLQIRDEFSYDCESEIDMEFIQNLLFNNETDYIIENNVDLNDSLIQCSLSIEESPKKNYVNNHIESPRFKIIKVETVPPDCFYENVSQDTSQKAHFEIGTVESISNRSTMNPIVVIEKLPLSFTKSKTPIKIKASTNKMDKIRELHGCSDCHFKTFSKNKMVFHLKKTNHSSFHYRKPVISKGNYYYMNLNKNSNTISNKHYQFRKKSSGCYCCCFKECNATASSWKFMYNHIKFTHLQLYKPSIDLHKDRNKIKRVPEDVNGKGKLDMEALVNLERLPAHIASSTTPIPMKQWLPCHLRPICGESGYDSFPDNELSNQEEELVFVEKTRTTISLSPTDENKYKTSTENISRLNETEEFRPETINDSEDESDIIFTPQAANKDNTSTEHSSRLNEYEEFRPEIINDSEDESDIIFTPLAALAANKYNTSTEHSSRLNEYEEFRPEIINDSGDGSDIIFIPQVYEKESDEAWQHWQQEIDDSPTSIDPFGSFIGTSSLIDPTLLPQVEVTLQKLPEPLLECDSITVGKDCAAVDDLSDSLDFLIQYCHTCQRMEATRKRLSVLKNCIVCHAPLLYMCTKCHDDYYVDYNSIIYHWVSCKNEKLRDVKINPMALMRCLKKEPLDCETPEETEFSAMQSNHQLFDGAMKFSENTVLRSLTATVTLEKLPEFTIKSERIIDNKNLNSGRKIKSKRPPFDPKSVTRYCCQCKKTMTDRTRVSRSKNCQKCSNPLQYVCPTCNDCLFFNYFSLKEHRQFCRPENEWEDLSIVLYRCLVCDFKTSHEFSMVSHLETTRHTSDDSNSTIQTAVAYCKSTFIQEQHDIDISNKIRRYCLRCRMFIPRACDEERCRKCDFYLSYHCIKCGEKEVNLSAMRCHFWAKCNPNRYQCVVCDYASSTWHMMQIHLERQHISHHLHCDQCDFRAKKKTILKRHIINCHTKTHPFVKMCTIDFDYDLSEVW